MSPFWVSGGGMSQVTSRLVGDTADTLIDWGATDGAAASKSFRLARVCVQLHIKEAELQKNAFNPSN